MGNDFELIRSIFIKDFDHFAIVSSELKMAKGIWPASRNEKLMLNSIQSAHGDEWKDIRSTFSPVFSSGKLRQMTPFLQATSKKMHTHVSKFAESGEEFETKTLMGKFSLDGLATCAFGVEAGSFDDEEGEFLLHAKNVFKLEKSLILKMILSMTCPTIVKKAAASLGWEKIFSWPFANEHSKFLMHVVETSFQQRKGSGTKRNDLLDLMIDAVKGNINDVGEQDLHADDQ